MSVNFNNKSTEKNSFYGLTTIAATQSSSITVDGNFKADFSADSLILPTNTVAYVYSTGTSNITLNGDASLGSEYSKNPTYWSMYSSTGSSINTNGGKLTAYGRMVSSGGNIDISTADQSYIWGTTSTTNNGVLNLNLNGNGSSWDMINNSSLSNLTLNGSTLRYEKPSDNASFTPKTLIVNGDYNSNNGTLVLNTVLADDASATDKLIVKGNTSGSTDVVINNIGGNGALTNTGIEIVEVNGNSAGSFRNGGRIVAGAYEYFVRSGATLNGANANNWYLVSDYKQPDPEPIPEPTPEPTPEPVVPVEPASDPVTPAINNNVYRPESGSYLANLVAANTLFMSRLHDRLGETQYTDVLTNESKVTSMWLRNIGGHNQFKSGDDQLKTTGNRYVVQLGGDVAQWSNNDLDRWHLGVMAGYANSQNSTRSRIDSYSSKGSIDGYSAGMYGTWYANNEDKSGAYTDTWVLYNWFNNEVKGEELATEKYKSSGITASIESGYSFKLGENEHASYWLQPKAQVVWMGVDANGHHESNGTYVVQDDANNIMTRLGVKLYENGHHPVDDGKDRTFQPFVEANWIHNVNDFAVKMNDNRNVQDGAKNIGEIKLGVEGKINNNLTLWGNVAQQLGTHSYSDTQAILAVKYSF
ncbi:autotransporter outer membrane beta-barrel domain-containing protein [Limnobaculum parvum]|uniref:Autotransporter outer membrane beta-barrel domain-containing protein n=2 Tax=Limnobaculum parvum TaxID=2172103 RepID=A0A2Y9U2A8_9GAMM|nr:autotransporter outer membrane beta-barrel domain-containing protein [Limnobaculum parvum]